MREFPELSSCQKIFEVRCGCWHAACDFVAANAGEHHTISLRRHAPSLLAVRFAIANARSRTKSVAIELEVERLLLADIDVGADAAPFFFHFGEVRALVPVGFGVMVVRQSIKPRRLVCVAVDNAIRHADDGGGIHAAAQLREDGTVGAESASDAFGEDGAEVLFVLGIAGIADLLAWIEIPVFPDSVLSRPDRDH